ncbi:SMP-30/gluconolactonase/LRE family protein [Niabella drilacis]|uniref:Regucalcin n=1 Tax=Niabella drilacis (strain DSM 25811 / CCM 8410 / CCUG 62505 / LMG 26954 / E90) TaxID=1285928 RepID=A0A1G7A5X7_NIADE|nr:SMP-30/gluconolactonase/LRE family protein [Niabella drilacis]SDE09877.1 Sugar lactone lactonase YvrE [Niabella drilacis]
MIPHWNAGLLYEAGLQLGEGACWDARRRRFLYVDIKGKKLGRLNPLTRQVEERLLDKMASAIIPVGDTGKYIVALQGSVSQLDFETGDLQTLVEIEKERSANRCNDGKCDAAGRLWFGTMHGDARAAEGALYRFDGSSLRKMMDKRSVSNGLGWSPDNRTMYYIDSFDYNIRAYDFDVGSGVIANERVIVDIEAPEQVPDGMCVDAEGMLWVAIWGAGAVHRYDPVTGALTGKVIVPAPHVTNCAFGGKDMQQLFITTARDGLTGAQLEQYPLSGSLFIADTGIRGLEGFEFKGT